MRILLLNGPNLGVLGRRQPEVYGSMTLDEIVNACRAHALERGALLDDLQSNHEGALIDRAGGRVDYDALICNFGALSHTSYALHDALLAADRPAVEVHISDITAARAVAPGVGHSARDAAPGHRPRLAWLPRGDQLAPRQQHRAGAVEGDLTQFVSEYIVRDIAADSGHLAPEWPSSDYGPVTRVSTRGGWAAS